MSEARLVVAPIDSRETFKDKAYTALRNLIVSSDVYRSRTDIRLDERQLAQDFGISRTPVREAMVQLEREGFVRSVPRRGVYVVRKTKSEVIELIQAWAALESMAARLLTQSASDADIAGHRLPPGHHRAQRQPGVDPAGGEPLHPHAHDPRQHDRRGR